MSEFVREESPVIGGGTFGSPRQALPTQLNGQAVSPALEEYIGRFDPVPVSPPAGSVSVASRAELSGLEAWQSAFGGQYKDSRYYDIVEETLHPEFQHRYFVLQDATGHVQAIQPFFLLDQDIIEGAGGGLKSMVARIRRRWPKFLSMRTLMVGCIAGEGHLDNQGAFADPSATLRLAAAALEEARRQKAGLIVFKEFPAEYRTVLKDLRSRGFIRLPSLPMSSLSIAYDNFDDYVSQALSRATRKDLRRKFKAARDAELEMRVFNDITPMIDEVYPLYLEVYSRSKLHFEKLTKSYLCELGRRMPDKTRFFVWKQDGRIVAFNLCMVHGDAVYDQYIGLDYTVALDLHLYHYTFRDIASWAMANGYKWYRSNGLNYDPKLHLRMQLDPLDLYVRHRWSIANAVMKIVLPWLEPTRHDKHLKKFPNYHELKGSR